MLASHPLIVIQSICTSWTKASRGGINASARNRTPEAVELPLLSASFPKDVFLLHSVMYSEHHHFQQPIQWLEQKELTDPFWYDCFKLSLVENTLSIMMEWERSKGMPRRLAFLRQGFSLHDPQWGRVIYNLRISWGEYWEYQKQVINIGFFAPSSPRIFLETEPAHNYVDMVRLR
jgi:hypothetical protein